MKMARNKDQKRWKEAGFVIRLVTQGAKRYQADWGTVDGTRERERFATLGEAKNACGERRKQLMDNGTASLSLADRDRLDATEARRLLGTGSILEAVQFYLKHYASDSGGRTVADLIEEYLKAPGKRGSKLVTRRPITITAARKRLAPFNVTFGKQPIAEVYQADVEGWIEAGGWTGLNRRHYVASVRALYGFAIRRGYVALNPADKIELPEGTEAPPPAILTPKQVTAILEAARKEAPDLLPRLAVSFFCGLRPTELTRLDWGAVNLPEAFITVSPETSKMRRQRHVDIPANLIQWLTLHRKASGPLWPLGETTYWHKLSRILKRARVSALPYNAGRHAFASYHLALHGDPGKTSLQLGHRDQELLFTTYRGILMTDGKPVSKATAQEYFEIRPKDQAEVIPFEAVG
jgi:integrase